MAEDKSKRYEKTKHLGEGQFANVYQAIDNKTGKFVAIKKIKLGSRDEAKDGINRTALREIKLLQEIHHENVLGAECLKAAVQLLDVIGHKTNISLVLEFMETDLEQVIHDASCILMADHIKAFIMMTLRGLEFLHVNWILHRASHVTGHDQFSNERMRVMLQATRDIAHIRSLEDESLGTRLGLLKSYALLAERRDLKPNNLLLNSDGVLKLGDFGLARLFGSPSRQYTHQVVTRWYRAPELLLGVKHYGGAIDVWAVGCILAELILRAPLFPGESDLDQLAKIFEVLGTPKNGEWQGIDTLPGYIEFRPMKGMPLRQIFPTVTPDLLLLIAACLAYDPLKRCSCTDALKLPYFFNQPAPAPGRTLPGIQKRPPIISSGGVKRRRDEDEDNSLAKKRLLFD